MHELPRVLIVGAGATGLTAAVELARQGLKPRIIDRDEGPTPLSKAVGISPHSLDILQSSGVAARLLAKGLRIRQAHLWFDGDELGAIDFAGVPHRFNFLLALPQSETETELEAALGELGVNVEWRTTLRSLSQGEGVVKVRFDPERGQEEGAEFDYVLGADGADSTVRQAAGVAFDGYEHRREWSIADVAIDDWPHEEDAAHVFLSRDGDIGFIIPIGVDRFRVISNTAEALAHIPGDYTIERIERTDTFHLPIRQAATYGQGRVFLAGDAAHVHSPIGARGMNLGIEDAACFAQRLIEDALDGYSAERRPVGARWIKLSERLLRAAQAHDAAAIWARNLAFRFVGHAPWMQRPILERVAGLTE